MWIARDKNGVLSLYPVKPVKDEKFWKVGYDEDFIVLNRELFPEVKWEDQAPVEVELLIKKK